MSDSQRLTMESTLDRMMAMRWESQETIATSREATPSEPETTKSIICGSQEFIIANPGAPFPDPDEKDSVRESSGDIVRNGDAPFDPDALDLDLEKLGRQRPECLPSAFREFAFCTSILSTMVMAEYFIAGAHIILPNLAEALQIPKASQTWVSSVLTLAAGASLLPLGRLADMHGGYFVFNAGLIWFSAWSLAAGFTTSPVPFIICRGMQGLGASAFLPTGIMLMGKIYRPGPRKNFVFGMYGAIAPPGFFFGMAMGGLSVEKLNWRWFFWMGSALGFSAVALSLVAIPRDWRAARAAGARMDWWGLGTLCPGLVFVVFAITQSSAAPRGWATPYIIVMMVLGVLFLAAGWLVQARLSADPFIPAEIFGPKYMKEIIIGLFLAYGCFGIFLYYSNFYIELVLHISPLNTAFWYSPWAIAGLIFAAISGVILHIVPGRILLLLSAASSLGSALFFALMPSNPNYWAHVLPSMVLQTAFVDVIYTTSNVFITTRLPARHQGLAGALINATLYVGICTFLGVADVAVAATSHLGTAASYKVAFWIVVGVSGVVMVLFAFVDIGSARSELTADEKRARSRMETGTSMETLTRVRSQG